MKPAPKCPATSQQNGKAMLAVGAMQLNHITPRKLAVLVSTVVPCPEKFWPISQTSR
jgi:hypothetical protein